MCLPNVYVLVFMFVYCVCLFGECLQWLVCGFSGCFFGVYVVFVLLIVYL